MPRRPDSISRHLGALVVAATLTAGTVAAIVSQAGDEALDLRAAPGAAWLSGEARGQVVLGSSGSELASLAVALSEKATQLTVIDTGASVFVHDAPAQKLLRLAAADGSTKNAITTTTVPEGNPTLIQAGSAVYLFDPSKGTVQRLRDDGTNDAPVAIGPFASAIGTGDGRLWLIQPSTGELTTVNGSRASTSRPSPPGSDVELTAVGDDPILIDRTNNRLRWLRRNVVYTPPVKLAESVVQVASPRSDCVAVLTGAVLRCFSPTDAVFTVELAATPAVGSMLMANDKTAAILRTGDAAVTLASWESASAQQFSRPSPSTRRPVLTASVGQLLIDDPGSAFAITVSGTRLTALDKFNRRTLLLGTDGEVIESAVARARTGAAAAIAPDARSIPDNRNDPPVAEADSVVTRSGRSVSIPVLSNDTDPDGDVLAVVEAGPATTGRVVVSELQRVVYTPPEKFVGQVELPYQITDAGNLRASGVVGVKVIDLLGNTRPVAAGDDAETSANVHVVIDVLSNDFDAEEDPLTITALGDPSNGTAAALEDGRVRYVPKPGFVGSDEFSYTAIDGFGGETTAAIRVRVIATDGSNRPPEPADDRAAIAGGNSTSLHIIENDIDPNGDPLRIVSVSDTAGLTLTIVDGRTIEALADDRTSGPVLFTYTVEDPAGLRATARVLLFVTAKKSNGAPIAVDDRVVVPSAPTVVDVAANDSDPDGDALTIVGFEPPTSGALARVSPTAFRYVPTPGQRGTVQFSYTISDPAGLTATAKVLLEVIGSVSSDPVAVDDVAEITAGQSATIAVLANDSHPDRLPISIIGEPLVSSGTARVLASQSIVFTPPNDSLATYVFSYTIGDANGRTSTAKVSVKVAAKQVNRAPIARVDQADTAYDTPVRLSPLTNDSDPDNDTLHLTTVSVTVGGVASHDGTTITFTPARDFAGIATGTYVVADNAGLTAGGQFVIQVSARPKQAPLTADDFASSYGGAAVTVSPLGNDSDPDGPASALVIVGVQPPNGVSATINGVQVTIDPPATLGTYSVRYTIADADGLTSDGTIRVAVVEPPNQAPIAANDSVITPFGVPVTIQVLSNDTDPDGGLLTITQAGPAAGGSISIVNGTVRFSPNASFSGATAFAYTIRDAGGLTATATVTVNVEACAAPTPVLTRDTAVTKFQTPVTINVLANDSQSTGTLTVGDATSGTATVVGQGQIQYRPPNGFNGNASFTYTVTNACGTAVSATVSVTVNRPPVANPDAASTTRNDPVTISVLTNDVDPDGDALTIAAISGGVHGTAAIFGDAIRFTPESGYIGTGSFAYTIGDIGGLGSTATVTVTIVAKNTVPTAGNDTATTDAGTSLVIPVLGNDNDPDADPLTITSVSAATLGTAAVQGSGILFNPGSAAGTSTFSYTISDGRGGTATASVTVTIRRLNNAPIAQHDDAIATVGQAIDIPVLANDSDPDGDSFALDAVDVIPGVSIIGSFVHYVATAPGTITFLYSIRDQYGAVGTNSITVVVSAPPTTTTTTTTMPAPTTEPAPSTSPGPTP